MTSVSLPLRTATICLSLVIGVTAKKITATPAITYKSSVWCGANDGMLTTKAACQAAATAHSGGTVQDAGPEWHAGCLIHGGNVYYSPLTAVGSHHQAVDGGYYCANTQTHQQGTWCGAGDGMIQTLAQCQTAATKNSLSFASQAGTEWHAGCIVHNGKAYFVPLTDGAAHDTASNQGFLCQNPAPTTTAAPTTTTTTTTPSPVNGNWGSWSVPGPCSATACGQTGVRTRSRTCSSPAPAHGGAECAGLSTDVSTACHTAVCPGTWSSSGVGPGAPWKTCPAGEGEAAPPSASSDRECRPCEVGKEYSNTDDGSICRPTVTCADSEYERVLPTLTTDRKCATHAAECGPHEYESQAPSGTQDRQCKPKMCLCPNGVPTTGAACTAHATAMCASCSAGHFLAGSSCLAHKTCGGHEFTAFAGTPTQDVQCRLLTICKPGEYADIAATATSDRRCAEKVCHCVGGHAATGAGCPAHGTTQCTSCWPGFRLESRVKGGDVKQCNMNSCLCEHGSAATGALCLVDGAEICSSCGVEKHMVGKVCHPNTMCDLSSSFISTEATETSDRVCQPFKVCTHTQFMVAPHTKYTDTLCQEHQKCGDGTWEEYPGTPTQDATCTAHRLCDAGEFESKVPWRLADRECEPCPVGHYCVNMKKHACLADTFQPKEKQSSCESCETIDALRRYGTAGKLGQIACTPVPLDCKAEEWGEWGACTLTCGGGSRTRRRLTEKQLPCKLPVSQLCSMEWGGGKGCHHLVLEQTQACNSAPCPIDCVHGEWSNWGTCSATCGGGTSTRTRSIIKAAVHGGKACGPAVGTVACNKHACDYKPRCHAEHVGCAVAEVRTGLGLTTARVMRVTHHRANMHVAANYQCRMINGFRECSCRCDKQPECCEHKNRILTNAVLLGNLFKDVVSSKACCDMCNTHPDCTSWEFVHAQSDAQIPGTCVLKGGSPSYIENPDLAMTTWAGVRAGLTGAKCQRPKYTIPAPTASPPLDETDHSQHAGVPLTHAWGAN